MADQEQLFDGGDNDGGADERPFEAVMAELEQIVGKLEAGDLSLEDSLDAFERGMALSQQAERRLDAAEQRVERLVSGGKTAPLQQPG